MDNLTPTEQTVLDTIASGESHGYNEVFGGHRFQSYAAHPQIEVKLPGGGYSTAAGRYQMTAPTWADEAHRLGLKDFSPASQDQAALDLAQRTYSQRTGRDLISDTAQGLTDWSVLGNQWTSLRRRPEPQAPIGAMQLAANLPALLKPAAALNPNPGSELDPVTALSALRAAAPGVSLSPVDHNPWSLAPSLIPVNHDPFQEVSNAP